MTEPTRGPGTTATPDQAREQRRETRRPILPPWVVILWNDDVNSMDHVVESLVRCVPKLSLDEAVGIMLTAHVNGHARVTACPLELAELYRDRLRSRGLRATVEQE